MLEMALERCLVPCKCTVCLDSQLGLKGVSLTGLRGGKGSLEIPKKVIDKQLSAEKGLKVASRGKMETSDTWLLGAGAGTAHSHMPTLPRCSPVMRAKARNSHSPCYPRPFWRQVENGSTIRLREAGRCWQELAWTVTTLCSQALQLGRGGDCI